jgi:CubicO group peptidase (beta-lactamase class C family)
VLSFTTTAAIRTSEHLFEPLEIDTFEWIRFGSAPYVTFASGGASLRPRDMAKLGAMYLNDGVWNGTQVLSSEWVDASTEMSIPLVGEYRTLYGYGYNWWLGRSQFKARTVEYFRAAGWGGQYVYVFPELEMIIVFTAGGYYETKPLDVNDLIEHYIFEAVIE